MYDVAIVGAGLSGSICAAQLSSKGLNVALLDRKNKESFHIPESTYLTPKETADLSGVTLEEIKGFFSNEASVCFKSAEGNDSISIKQVMNEKTGPFILDRGRLDSFLLDKAIKQGCHYLPKLTVLGVEFEKSFNQLIISDDNEKQNLKTKFVVDASGKQAFLANQLNLKSDIAELDKRISIFSHFINDNYYEAIKSSSVTIIEILDGYLYIIPLSNGRFTVGVTIDNKSYSNVLPKEVFYSSISKIDWLKQVLSESEQVLPFIPVINESFHVSRPSDHGYFIVGEALGFSDPFYCDGISFVLASVVGCVSGISELLSNATPEKTYQKYNELILSKRNNNGWHTFLNNSFGISMRCLADPHIPYGLSHFLLKSFDSGVDSSIRKMEKVRSFFDISGAKHVD